MKRQCKIEKCENTAYYKTAQLCRNHYWQKLYAEKRITFKGRRAKYNQQILYFDSNMNRRASPDFELLFHGTT